MAEAILETKKWGNSVGLVLPKAVLDEENIKGEHETLFVLVRKKDNVFSETFGILEGKMKKSTQKLKDEIRKDLYD